MSLTLAGVRAATTPRWASNELWRRARAVPSLDLPFADNRSLVDAVSGQQLITFSRASEGTLVNSDGQIQTAAANTPRFDHNPTTGESLGLLVEEQRTNSIRNNTMVGAVAGTPGTLPTNWGVSGLGTLAQQVVGVGTVNGISYIDLRLSGTTSTVQLSIRFEPNGTGGISASNGQSWTGSAWTAVVGGSLLNITQVAYNCNLWDSGSQYINGLLGFNVNLTGSLARTSGSGVIATANTAAIQPQIYFLWSSGVPIDITLRIGMPQLELGAFATSVIPTTGTAATRAADVATITGTNFSSWFGSPNENTMYVEGVKTSNNSVNGCFVSGGNGINAFGGSNINYDGNGTRIRLQSRHGAARGDTASNAPLSVVGALQKAAVCTSASTFGGAVNGQLLTGSAIAQADWGSGLSIGFFPNGGFSAFLNGHIRRLVFFPQRLPNATLQRITL